MDALSVTSEYFAAAMPRGAQPLAARGHWHRACDWQPADTPVHLDLHNLFLIIGIVLWGRWPCCFTVTIIYYMIMSDPKVISEACAVATI